MKIRSLLILSIIFLFSACGGDFESTSDESSKKTINAAAITEQTASPMPTFQVDVENNQVYLESTGWISAGEFWEIYYNDPAKLPGDLNHEELAKLGMPAATQGIQN